MVESCYWRRSSAFSGSRRPAYFTYARQFTLGDNYCTDVAGPATPHHLMVITADSPIIDNPNETIFGLKTLNARDAAADGTSDCFDSTQKPAPPPIAK